jgi:hypothetical protein
MLQNYNRNIDKTYCILNYTRIKPRSRPPHKKSAYFTQPDFSAAKIKKRVQITRANTLVSSFTSRIEVGCISVAAKHLKLITCSKDLLVFTYEFIVYVYNNDI